MATKKPTGANAKKPVIKSAPASKKTSTKVTTVTATPNVSKSATASRTDRSSKFKFSRSPLLASSVAEFIGTFLLAGVVLAASGQPLFVLFAVLAVVLVIGGVSGAHLNPALTLGALATKRISAVRALSYIVAQVLGALLALVLLNAFIGAAPEVSQQAEQFGQAAAPTLFSAPNIADGKQWVVLAAELLGSVILAFAVAGSSRRNKMGDLHHAFTYGAGLYVALLLAGTAANYVGASAILSPAVAASLQALDFDLWAIMVYGLTPLVGAVIGFALSDVVRTESETIA